jgi:hypothetical protein
MPEQVERDHTLATRAHLASAALPLVAESHEQAMVDPYREIADRRAQLENAETLRRARAL